MRISIYKDKALQLGYVLGAFASVWSVTIAIWIQFARLSWWMAIPSVPVLVLMLFSTLAVIKSETPTKLYKVDDRSGIRNYLYKWIKNGGRVVIWTRDMSWTNDEEINQLLIRKAQAKELIICLPRNIEKSDALKQHGAEVIAYGTLDAPATSFTITNYGRGGSRVAVGRPSGKLHVIQEFSQGEHPAFHMAEDLVRLVREQNNADG